LEKNLITRNSDTLGIELLIRFDNGPIETR